MVGEGLGGSWSVQEGLDSRSRFLDGHRGY